MDYSLSDIICKSLTDRPISEAPIFKHLVKQKKNGLQDTKAAFQLLRCAMPSHYYPFCQMSTTQVEQWSSLSCRCGGDLLQDPNHEDIPKPGKQGYDTYQSYHKSMHQDIPRRPDTAELTLKKRPALAAEPESSDPKSKAKKKKRKSRNWWSTSRPVQTKYTHDFACATEHTDLQVWGIKKLCKIWCVSSKRAACSYTNLHQLTLLRPWAKSTVQMRSTTFFMSNHGWSKIEMNCLCLHNQWTVSLCNFV